MTKEDIEKRVQEIQERADDDEMAHAMEKDLHEEVLEFLAEQGNELAEAALKTLDIDFSRWFG